METMNSNLENMNRVLDLLDTYTDFPKEEINAFKEVINGKRSTNELEKQIALESTRSLPIPLSCVMI